MAKTRAELATRMLKVLRVVGAGQAPDSEDQETADNAIPSLFADLEIRNVYSVSDEDDIDLAAFEWIAICGAYIISSEFPEVAGISESRHQYAEYMLRRITSSAPTLETLQVDYF